VEIGLKIEEKRVLLEDTIAAATVRVRSRNESDDLETPLGTLYPNRINPFY